MSGAVALVRGATADVGPEQTFDTRVQFSIGDDEPTSSVNVRVTYVVSYPSVWHRGKNEDGKVDLGAVKVEINHDWKDMRLPSFLLTPIRDRIEAAALLGD